MVVQLESCLALATQLIITTCCYPPNHCISASQIYKEKLVGYLNTKQLKNSRKQLTLLSLHPGKVLQAHAIQKIWTKVVICLHLTCRNICNWDQESWSVKIALDCSRPRALDNILTAEQLPWLLSIFVDLVIIQNFVLITWLASWLVGSIGSQLQMLLQAKLP